MNIYSVPSTIIKGKGVEWKQNTMPESNFRAHSCEPAIIVPFSATFAINNFTEKQVSANKGENTEDKKK